jgi:hypothetical protein
MMFVTQPERYDVVVTENMFGDIVSDLAAGIVGGLGMAPSGDVSETHGRVPAEPRHGAGHRRARRRQSRRDDPVGGDDARMARGAEARRALRKRGRRDPRRDGEGPRRRSAHRGHRRDGAHGRRHAGDPRGARGCARWTHASHEFNEEKKMFRRLAAALFTLAFAAAAHAQYPNKPVKLIVPYPAGQATDIAARIVGEALAKEWGQPVVIENIGGGAAIPGIVTAKGAAPDGYTLLMGTSAGWW